MEPCSTKKKNTKTIALTVAIISSVLCYVSIIVMHLCEYEYSFSDSLTEGWPMDLSPLVAGPVTLQGLKLFLIMAHFCTLDKMIMFLRMCVSLPQSLCCFGAINPEMHKLLLLCHSEPPLAPTLTLQAAKGENSQI